MHENEIGTLILDAAFQVHKELGPGLFGGKINHGEHSGAQRNKAESQSANKMV